MKTHDSITGLFLILSVGCSCSVEQAEIEANQDEERQLSLQVMQDTFIAASNSLQAVPMAPLVVTSILCNPFREAESPNRVMTPKDEVGLAASRGRTEGELEHLTDN
jgi:hypothetical protein